MKKKIIVMIIINILILFVVLIGIIMLNNNAKKDNTPPERTEEIAEVSQTNTIEDVDTNNEVFTIQDYLQKYLEQININNELYYTGDERLEQSIISEWTYSLLSKEYIDKNNITNENVFDYVDKVEENLLFVPLKMKKLETENTIKYAVYGFCQTITNEYKGDKYFIFNVDNTNNTYSIEPLKNIESIDKINLADNSMKIDSNRYNGFKLKEMTDEEVCEQYLFMYKRLLLLKPDEAYEFLNEEYRNQKFETKQEYITYVSENKDKISKMILKAYSVKDNRYMCQDADNNYYVFNIKKPLDYNVMLDVYTVDLQEFIDRYNSSKEENKVALNITKIENAINTRDYRYIYNKLDETFKNNNFKSEDSLKKYIEENFFDNNKIKNESISVQGNIYVYKAKLINAENDEDTKNLTMIIKLLNGTDFAMSFSM